MFTQDQLEELFDIIDNQVLFFIANNIGADFLSKKDRKLLKQAGFDLSVLDNKQGYVDYAFKFGMLSEALSDERAKDMKYDEFKKFVNSGKFVPLNDEEKATILSLKNQSLSDIKGLGNKAKGDVQDIIDNESQQTRNWYEKVIREEGKATVEMRESVKDMKSRIGHRTGNWNRDFDRICETVLHNAFDEGRASNMKREYDGDDPLVYKDVFKNACEACVRLYTTNGVGSKPKVFRLSTLRKNGSNVGRKKKEWKAVLGSTHPYSIIDPAIPILTKDGYKEIQYVEEGDYVMTHRGRWRKVLSTLKHFPIPKEDKFIYKVYYDRYLSGVYNDGYSSIPFTGKHKVLTEKGWVYVEDLSIDNKLIEYIKGRIGEKGFVECDINCIKKDQPGKDTKLYDIEVEEDESFIANGIVVHNCRCTLRQVPKDYIWSDEKGRFVPDPNRKRKVKRQSKVGVRWKNK